MSVAPSPSVSREVVVGRRRRVNLVKLARAQRLLLQFVLGVVCAYIGFFMVVAFSARVPAPAIFMMVLPVLALVLLIACLVQTVRLEIAAGGHPVVACLIGLLMLLPFVGLIIAAIVNARATKVLRAYGAVVGFLGVTKDEMYKLTLGCCRRCGYPTAGLQADRCPECGYSIEPLAAVSAP
jgi:hypothetical protein